MSTTTGLDHAKSLCGPSIGRRCGSWSIRTSNVGLRTLNLFAGQRCTWRTAGTSERLPSDNEQLKEEHFLELETREGTFQAKCDKPGGSETLEILR